MHDSNTIHIHICTKDRPSSLARLLNDLDAVVSLRKKVFVYDDSVDSSNRASNRAALSAMPYPTVYFDETRRIELLHGIPWPSNEATDYASYAFKSLGQPGWDLAGVRAFAHFIAGSHARAQEKVLFLDDDLSLTGDDFQGRQYTVDSEAIDSILKEPLSAKHFIGARYAGRSNVYLHRHLSSHSSRSNSLASDGQADQLPSSKPTGGFLLLHGEDIRRIPIPRCYSEDAIFIRLSVALGCRTGIAPFRPLHSGDDVYPSFEIAVVQQIGIVVFRALSWGLDRISAEDIPALAATAIAHCGDQAEVEAERWKEILSSPSSTGFNFITEENKYFLLDENRIEQESVRVLKSYFEQWPGWHSLINSTEIADYLTTQLLITN